MKVLITGIHGGLGSIIATQLRHDSHEIFGIARKSTRPEVAVLDMTTDDLGGAISIINPDVVIHCASNSNPQDDSSYLTNTSIAYNLGTALKSFAPRARLIHLSSILVYGNIVTEMVDETSEPCPQSPYALGKLHAEECLSNLVDKVLHVRCATVATNHPRHGMIKDVFDRAEHAIATGTALEMWSKYPGPFKPYIHIEDVIRYMSRQVKKDDVGTINLCAEGSVPFLLQMGKKIYRNTGKKPKWIGHDTGQYIYCKSIFNHSLKYRTSNEVIQQIIEDRFP